MSGSKLKGNKGKKDIALVTLEYEKKKKLIKKIILVLLIIVIAFILFFLGYKFYKRNSILKKINISLQFMG